MSKRIFIKPEEFLQRDLIITDHSVKRYNERVHNETTREYIENFIKEKAKRNDIQLQWSDYYLVDDVCMCFSRIGEKIKLETVMGSVIDNPCLYEIRRIIRNGRKYGKISLGIDSNTPLQSI